MPSGVKNGEIPGEIPELRFMGKSTINQGFFHLYIDVGLTNQK